MYFSILAFGEVCYTVEFNKFPSLIWVIRRNAFLTSGIFEANDGQSFGTGEAGVTLCPTNDGIITCDMLGGVTK